jgi:long-chain acyl-CoA synthetase
METTTTLRELLNNSVKKYQDLPALGYAGKEYINYLQLGLAVQRLASKLQSEGVQKGDRVALFAENQPNWAIVYFAVTSIGAVIVPILPDFSPDEVKNILNHSGSKVVFLSKKLGEKLGKLSIVSMPIEELEIPASEGSYDAAAFSEALVPEDLAAIIYTSGTTGASKGVMLSHGNIVSNANASADIPQVRPRDRMFSILPLSHTYECTLGMILPLSRGANVAYLDKPPAPSVMIPALAKVRPHLMLSVPLLIEKIYRGSVQKTLQKSPVTRALLKFPPTRILLHKIAGKKLKKTFGGNLYFFGIGGAPLAPEVEKFLKEAGFPYCIGYGLTETSPLVAGTNAKHTKRGFIGPVLRGVQMRLANPDPETGEGEVQVLGPNVMQGYYKDEAKTREVFTEDGWFKTGDLGYIEGKKGYLSIRGRLKNLILGPSGENIYPEAIEAVINEYEFVEDTLVFQEGNKLVAKVHLNLDELGEHWKQFSESAKHFPEESAKYLKGIMTEANKRLASFMKIHEIQWHKDPFEKTPTKKIKRYLYEDKDGVNRAKDDTQDSTTTDSKE